jgi:hypothetical protein
MAMNEQDIFLQVLEIESPEKREEFLTVACHGDCEFRARIEQLLVSYHESGNFLEFPAMEPAPTLLGEGAMESTEGPTDNSPEHTILLQESVDSQLLDFLEPTDTPGRIGRMGAYEVIEVIGRGGMGIVLKAFDPHLSRIVAIKTLAPEYANNPTARKRFARESQAAAAVAHPHVVMIHAVEPSSTVPYLVMEFVQGQSLRQKLDHAGALEVREILRIGSQIAQGLAAAHERSGGRIHRCRSPAHSRSSA